MLSEGGVEALITAVTANPAIDPISGNILFISGVMNPSVLDLIFKLSIALETAQVCIVATESISFWVNSDTFYLPFLLINQ
tara:strand:- start:178 stop:420 length:243 start_codon:yes stop_codon:yes gene_type:complete